MTRAQLARLKVEVVTEYVEDVLRARSGEGPRHVHMPEKARRLPVEELSELHQAMLASRDRYTAEAWEIVGVLEAMLYDTVRARLQARERWT